MISRCKFIAQVDEKNSWVSRFLAGFTSLLRCNAIAVAQEFEFIQGYQNTFQTWQKRRQPETVWLEWNCFGKTWSKPRKPHQLPPSPGRKPGPRS